MNGKKFTLNHDLVALLFLVAMVIWFSHEMVWSDKVPFFRDLGVYFYPMRFSVAQSFKAGELPLWDRHMGMGFPLLADFQSGVFYPPHIFYLVLPFFTAIRTVFIFHYLVAATGSYLLCRQWQFPPYLALIGAALFAFGGTIVSLTNLLNHFQTAVWLPWVILFWERALQSGSWRALVAFALISLVQFLAGSPELYILTLGLLFLDGLSVQVKSSKETYGRAVFLLLVSNLLVVGLAMVQVLPTIELFFQSRGRVPLGFRESPLWSLHPLNLINLFFLDKEVDPSVGSGVHLFFLQEGPFLISYYLGSITLIGISLWLIYGSLKERILLLSLIAFSLVLAMGGYTPVYLLLYHYLPFMSFFRFPEKFFFFTNALMLFAALKGLFLSWCSEKRSGTSRFFSCVACLLFFLLPYLFFRFDTGPLSQLISHATKFPLLSTETLARTSSVLVSLERQIALLCGILLLLFLWQLGRLQTPLFQALIVGVVFVDLASAHRPYQYLLDPSFIDNSPRIIYAPDSEPNRLFYYPGDANLHPSYYSILRHPSFAELQSLVFGNLVPNAGVFNGFDYMQELDALRRWPYIVFLDFANRLPPERLYRLLGVLNVEYVVSFHQLPPGIPLIHHFPQYPSWLYRISHVIPRAYIVSRTMEEKDPLKTLDRLSSAEFDPNKVVILEKPLRILPKKNFQARANIVQYKNQDVAIHASLNGSGVLVLADSFYPGWRVFVDGKEKEILRANLFFRGVFLSPGEHIVEFRYEPRSFKIGLIISLITLGGVVICSLLISGKHRVGQHRFQSPHGSLT